MDKLCDIRYCQRRHEGGYSVCVFMDDPCYFCIRFGSEEQCFNQWVTQQCRPCHERATRAAREAQPPRSPPPPYPGRAPHFRVLRRLDKDEDPRTAEVARDDAHHRLGLLSLNETTLRIHQAVLAGTHK